jgi:serine/threonine protein kinase
MFSQNYNTFLCLHNHFWQPRYMSPQQLQGKILTLKVDVWALGVVLWELLNEQVPWTDIGCNDRKELARKVAVGGAHLKKTSAEKLTGDKAAQAAFDTIIDGDSLVDRSKHLSNQHGQDV